MLSIWCEIVCDICAKTGDGEWSTGRINRARLQSNSEALGFIRYKGEMYCSNECLQKEKSYSK